jgi:hypothetical protein
LSAGTATATTPHPQALSLSRKAPGYYSLAANARGDRIVVLAHDLAPAPAGVDVFSAAPGSPFGPPSRQFSPRVPDLTAFGAVGPDGTAAVVGVPSGQPPRDPRQVMALVRPPGGAFDGPMPISGEYANEPFITFDRQGNAVAVWARDGSGSIETYIEQSTRPSGGQWSAPTVIAREKRYSDAPEVAFDAKGGAVAVWTRESVGRETGHDIPGQVVAAVRPPGGDFGRLHVVSPPRLDSGDPSLAVDPQGRAAIVWVSNTRGDKHFRIGAAFRRPGSDRFGTPRLLTPGRIDGVSPSVALDARGRGLITFTVRGDGPPELNNVQIEMMFRSRSGRLSRPRPISGRRADFLYELTMNRDGRAIVSWIYQGRRSDVVQTRRVTTGGSVGRLRRVSPRGWIDDLRSTIDDRAVATLVWTRTAGRIDRVEAVTLAP